MHSSNLPNRTVQFNLKPLMTNMQRCRFSSSHGKSPQRIIHRRLHTWVSSENFDKYIQCPFISWWMMQNINLQVYKCIMMLRQLPPRRNHIWPLFLCCVTLYKGHLSDLENRFTLILEIPCRTISVEPFFKVWLLNSLKPLNMPKNCPCLSFWWLSLWWLKSTIKNLPDGQLQLLYHNKLVVPGLFLHSPCSEICRVSTCQHPLKRNVLRVVISRV